MTGTILNVITIVVGSLIGNTLGGRLPERLHQTVVNGLGLFTMLLGIQMFLKTQNTLLVLGSLIIGTILGEWWQIESGLHRLGEWLEKRFASKSGAESGQDRFMKGFLTASLLFCIGPVAILGSLQDGLTGNYELLVVKSTMDGLVSIAFASTLGMGVAFSALPTLVYQGAITLLAYQLQPLMTDAMVTELTATGGILLMGLAFSGLLEIRKIRVGNMLPALLIAPSLVGLIAQLTALGWIK